MGAYKSLNRFPRGLHRISAILNWFTASTNARVPMIVPSFPRNVLSTNVLRGCFIVNTVRRVLRVTWNLSPIDLVFQARLNYSVVSEYNETAITTFPICRNEYFYVDSRSLVIKMSCLYWLNWSLRILIFIKFTKNFFKWTKERISMQLFRHVYM